MNTIFDPEQKQDVEQEQKREQEQQPDAEPTGKEHVEPWPSTFSPRVGEGLNMASWGPMTWHPLETYQASIATQPLSQSGSAGLRTGGSRRGWRATFVALALLVVFAIGLAGAVVGARSVTASASTVNTVSGTTQSAASSSSSSSATALQGSIESVVSSVQPSVVEVIDQSGSSESIGSGDVLTANGYIVTNDHVIENGGTVLVTLSSGQTVQAKVVGQDAKDDLAVLKVSVSNLKPITLADSSATQVGAFAIAIGNPLGLQQTVTLGIVSATNRTASEAPSGPAGTLTGLIQTSAALNPGNSGGALVNLEGQLIGIPTLGVTDSNSGSTASGIGFAISSNVVKSVTTQIINAAAGQ